VWRAEQIERRGRKIRYGRAHVLIIFISLPGIGRRLSGRVVVSGRSGPAILLVEEKVYQQTTIFFGFILPLFYDSCGSSSVVVRRFHVHKLRGEEQMLWYRALLLLDSIVQERVVEARVKIFDRGLNDAAGNSGC